MRMYFNALLIHNFAHTLLSMTTLEHAPHAVRRKAYSPHYIPANIARFQPEIHEVTLELVSVCVLFRVPMSTIIDLLVISRPLRTLLANLPSNALDSSDT